MVSYLGHSHFQRLKNLGLDHDFKFYKIVEVCQWICCNKDMQIAVCPNGVLLAKIF